METNYFHYSFKLNPESVDKMIDILKKLFENNNIDIKSIENNTYEEEEIGGSPDDVNYTGSISIITENKEIIFTYDDNGSPCVDLYNKDGDLTITLKPQDYDELMSQPSYS